MKTFLSLIYLLFHVLSLTAAQDGCDCASQIEATASPLRQEIAVLQDQKHALLQDIEQLRKSLDVARTDVQNLIADRDEWERRARAWEQEALKFQNETNELKEMTLFTLIKKQITSAYDAMVAFFSNLMTKKEEEATAEF